ncbi:hypothetical protein DOJK_01447 [Patescibacteria group bacterium]|nr:hypothetical protein DOJK_01447 [Patescibacteria group bacterium]
MDIMENNTDRCKSEGEPKYQNKSNAETKLESKEYLDSRIHDFDRIDQKVKDYKQELISLIRWYCGVFGIVVVIGGWGVSYGIMNQLKSLLSSRLDKEFESEKIQKLIEDKAKEFTEKRAETFLSDKIKELLVPLEEKMKLYNIADRAEGGSKAAYLELQEVVKRENGDIAMIAKTKLISIKRTLDIYSIIPGGIS